MQMWANATIFGREGLWDIIVENNTFSKIVEAGSLVLDNVETIDLSGKLICAPFVEPHIHLDTTLTAGQPRWNESGTLFEGIQRWSERKEFLTKERSLKDFDIGLIVPGKLLPKRIKGGVVLGDTTYEMR